MRAIEARVQRWKVGAAVLRGADARLVLGAAEQHAGAGVEHRVGGRAGRRALLGHLVAQVLDQQLPSALVQHRKAVARDEHRRRADAALGLLRPESKLQAQQTILAFKATETGSPAPISSTSAFARALPATRQRCALLPAQHINQTCL